MVLYYYDGVDMGIELDTIALALIEVGTMNYIISCISLVLDMQVVSCYSIPECNLNRNTNQSLGRKRTIVHTCIMTKY